MSIFKLEDGSCYFNVIIKDEKGQAKYDLSKARQKDSMVEVLAFRMVYTAGFALPIYEIIMTSSTKSDLELFNQANNVEIYYGTSPDKKDVFTCDTVGHHIKRSPQEDVFCLNWGGVVKNGKMGSRFLEEEQTEVFSGTALQVLQTAWIKFTGTAIDVWLDKFKETSSIERKYRIPHETAQNSLLDIFLHIDVRPSFPMAYINKKGNLVLRDFQSIKAEGPKAIFSPATDGAMGKMQKAKQIIPYIGNPEPISFKPFINRTCGYTQINAKDVKSGKFCTLSSDLEAQKLKSGKSKKYKSFFNNLFKKKKSETGDSTNKLATSQANEARTSSHVSDTTQRVYLGEDIPKAYHEVCIHNKNNLINMSAVQLQLRVEGTYVNQVQVLDLVEVNTGMRSDKISGNWIIEAIEQGFVDGKSANIIYLCRDNLNDVEGTKASTFAELISAWLGLSADDKAEITNMVMNSRQALAVCKGVLDETYIHDFQSHLIGMKRGALSNFNLFDTGIDLNSADRITETLRNNGQMLANKAMRSFIKDPYATFFYNVLLGDSNLLGFFMLILSTILGGELYNAFAELFADLRYFDLFLQNYRATIKSASQEAQPNYAAAIVGGILSYQESPSGQLIPVVLDSYIDTPKRMNSMPNEITEDYKIELRDTIVDEVVERIPDGLDIPIPEIELSDSEAILPEEELSDLIVDTIVDSLVSRGYVYDGELIDNATTSGTIIAADGNEVSYDYAKINMLSSTNIKEMLLGNIPFDAESVNKVNRAIGSEVKIRHWGTFVTYNDLTSFNINRGYIDKYKTVNATKIFSCNGGQRVYVALPASEKNTKFYINSSQSIEMENNRMEIDNLGYYDSKGNPIPYIIYYTTEDFDTSNLTLEMRKN